MNIDLTVKALINNNFDAVFISSPKKLYDIIDSEIKPGNTVGYGGSVTLDQLKIKERLRQRDDITIFDRDISGKRLEDMHNSLTADVFLMSSNAITENGELCNIDGNGNRCAALIFGPKKVIVVCGKNKIVKDVNAAFERIKIVAAPLNAKRLNRNTPCSKNGHCVNCHSLDRICSSYVVSGYQQNKNRIKVLILDETLGY